MPPMAPMMRWPSGEAVSMVLGGEVLVNFLLNLYRPRKPGEMPRPAARAVISITSTIITSMPTM